MGDQAMNPESDRNFHLERAEQCRRMATESTDTAVRQLHEELAAFHEAEARRLEMPMPANENPG
ncbi:MAG TPA: hypothetical protein VL917_07725 [Sphingomicrobium sp.]|nr:hypothetical protein [Sphingomicrobium sp.]